MLSKVMQLEAVKQKNAFVSILIILAVTILVVNAEALINHRNLREVLSALAAVLMVAGVPLLAVLLGGSAGTGLRGQTARSAEEMLPFSPVRKVLGAYLTSLLYLAAAGSALTAAGFALSDAGVLESIDVPVFLIPAMSALLHLFSFLFCYWLGQPFFGGGLALLLAGAEGYLLFVQYNLRWIHGIYGTSLAEAFTASMVVSLLAAAVGGVAALVVLARRVEHEKRLWLIPGFAAALLVSAALPISLTPILRLQHRVNSNLSPVLFSAWIPDIMDTSGRVQSTLAEGVILETPNGSVVRVGSDGRRQVLFHAAGVSLLDIVRTLRRFGIDMSTNVGFSPDGSTWLLTQPDEHRNPNMYEIIVADSGGHPRHLTTFTVKDDLYPRLGMMGEEMGLWDYPDMKRGWVYSPIPREGQQPVWRETGYRDWSAGRMWATGQGLLVEVGDDGRTLTWEHPDGSESIWILPGPAVINDARYFHLSPLYGKENQPSFVLPVQDDEQNAHLYVCRSDGSVQRISSDALPVGKTSGLVPRMIPGGGMMWRPDTQNPESILVVDPEGKAFPLLHTKGLVPPGKAFGFFPRRLSGNNLWALFSGHFIEIDLSTGKLVRDFGDIAKDAVNRFYGISSRSSKEGLYRVAGGRIQLITWEGERKDLGPATLD
jgi:hypothetical protein